MLRSCEYLARDRRRGAVHGADAAQVFERFAALAGLVERGGARQAERRVVAARGARVTRVLVSQQRAREPHVPRREREVGLRGREVEHGARAIASGARVHGVEQLVGALGAGVQLERAVDRDARAPHLSRGERALAVVEQTRHERVTLAAFEPLVERARGVVELTAERAGAEQEQRALLARRALRPIPDSAAELAGAL